MTAAAPAPAPPEPELQFPPVKFCPSCRSENLCPPFEGHEEHAQRTGSKFGECADCGTHFTVSGFHTFHIPDEEEEEEG